MVSDNQGDQYLSISQGRASEPLIHPACYVNQNLPCIQGSDNTAKLLCACSIHCWFVLSEISQMSLATSTLLHQNRSHMEEQYLSHGIAYNTEQQLKVNVVH